jgi:hypothetical protein
MHKYICDFFRERVSVCVHVCVTLTVYTGAVPDRNPIDSIVGGSRVYEGGYTHTVDCTNALRWPPVSGIQIRADAS